MSYILDALKRADAERERGTVPGLHAQPAPLAASGARVPGRLKPLAWAGAGAAVLLLAALAWRLTAREAPPAAQVPAPAPAPAATAAPAPSAVAAAPAMPAGTLVMPPAPARPSAPPPPPEAAALARKPDAAAPAASAPQAPQAAQQAASAPQATAAAPAAPVRGPTRAEARAAARQAEAPASAPAAEPRVYTLNELPEDVRRQLPALTISGATYSENPAYRMLIINGQVFHEGEKPTSELALEQIRPKAAVFSFRGYRYSVAY
jgi:general secretion pathway protein B